VSFIFNSQDVCSCTKSKATAYYWFQLQKENLSHVNFLSGSPLLEVENHFNNLKNKVSHSFCVCVFNSILGIKTKLLDVNPIKDKTAHDITSFILSSFKISVLKLKSFLDCE
jgi:hypothetical protein